MKTLKVLHVASFQGNIGDNANHKGFRQSLEKNLGIDFIYTDFEIRKVFWKQEFFDERFVTLANNHDLVVVGGGNYFELWVENSATGTSFDMSFELFSQITSPVVFNALGVDPAQGAKEGPVQRFRDFLDLAFNKGNVLFSCRNDGSMNALETIVGQKYADMFHHVPDAGFFTNVIDTYHPELDTEKKNILIQIAGDMLETRFPNETEDDISFEEFIESLAGFIVKAAEKEDAHFILVPHIFRDIGVIDTLLNSLPDSIRRGCVSVAPYLIGQKGQDYIFDLYSKVNLVLGMRFHANVCGLGLGVPSIGLVNYRQIDELYSELGLNAFKVAVNKRGYDQKLLALTSGLLRGECEYPSYIEPWEEKLRVFHIYIKEWLTELEVI